MWRILQHTTPAAAPPAPSPQVLEHCSGGELLSRTRGGRHYSERTAASFLRAVLRTVAQVGGAGTIGQEGRRQAVGLVGSEWGEEELQPCTSLAFNATPATAAGAARPTSLATLCCAVHAVPAVPR